MTRELLVGLATFQRPGVVETLRSLDALEGVRPSRIIIADNDETPSAEELINELRSSISIPFTYLHAPAANIAIARNAVLEAAGTNLLAFIDDDETAAPDWLAELLAKWDEGIAAVVGPMIAEYPDSAPLWMKTLSPHSQIPPLENGLPYEGHTANCLIDLAHPVMQRLRFDPDFGRKGGSDSVYFTQALQQGVRLAYAEAARVYEPVTPKRLSRTWLLRRRWRFGLTLSAKSDRPAWRQVISSLAKATYCAGDALLHAYSPVGFHRALLRGTMHLGAAAGAMGGRMGEWYGKDGPA